MNKQEQKIEKFFEQRIYTGALNISVLKSLNGDHFVFGKYLIKSINGSYSVTQENGHDIVFSTLKVAITWCVFHDKKLMTECKEIEKVDFKLYSVEIDISQHNKILNNTKDTQIRMIYYSKLEDDDDRKKILLEKLNKYINMSRRWQNYRYTNAKPTNKR